MPRTLFERALQRRCGLTALSCVVFLQAAGPALAGRKPTESDLRRLPAYCRVKLTLEPENPDHPFVTKWKQILGRDWMHVSFYCDSLAKINTARKTTNKNTREALYVAALSSLNYMVRQVNSDFPLLPEIFVKKAELLIALEKPEDAKFEFLSAVTIKRDYPVPYIGLATLLKLQGRIDEALLIARYGQSYNETSQSLTKLIAALEDAAKRTNRSLALRKDPSALPWLDVVRREAERHRLDPRLVRAVIYVESGDDPLAVSPKGAQGLMQLMPETAQELGVENAFQPQENIQGGISYLASLIERFDGRLDLALAGYNAGPAAVERYGGIPPYPETEAYVQKVLDIFRRQGGNPLLALR